MRQHDREKRESGLWFDRLRRAPIACQARWLDPLMKTLLRRIGFFNAVKNVSHGAVLASALSTFSTSQVVGSKKLAHAVHKGAYVHLDVDEVISDIHKIRDKLTMAIGREICIEKENILEEGPDVN